MVCVYVYLDMVTRASLLKQQARGDVGLSLNSSHHLQAELPRQQPSGYNMPVSKMEHGLKLETEKKTTTIPEISVTSVLAFTI